MQAARLLIHKRLGLNQADAKFHSWKRKPELFPYFGAYLKASIFSPYDADRNQNSELDLNWQADAEQLCFLNHADLIVSSDESFMKRGV